MGTATVETVPHVVIIGGGFGGLTATQALAGARVRVTLLDRTNHHTFQPLLYQIATAGLSPADIAQPIRSIVHQQENVTVLLGKAVGIDLAAKAVHLEDGEVLRWDFLIVACGAETSYFGHDEWRDVAPGLKSIADAVAVRTRVLVAFEVAERTENAALRDELLSFAVIGGGPTGVELAGAMAELSKFVLERDFRRIDPSATKVRLLEAGPRILPTFPEDLSASAVSQLHELGVEVRTNARVTRIEPGKVHLGDEVIPASVVVWAAGVRAQPLTATLGVPTDKMGRVLIEKDLSVPGQPDAFVIGDAARLDGDDGKPLPGVSPVAMQQARWVAKTIRGALARAPKPRKPFHYFDKGSLATIGRSRAIAQVDKMHLSGLLAWLVWLLVHIFYLIGFKNRIVVMFTWAWSYVTYRRGSRLVTAEPTAGLLEIMGLPPPPRAGGPTEPVAAAPTQPPAPTLAAPAPAPTERPRDGSPARVPS
ncbi:MAG TPA: NAD(P)/FAD-dependent oxidoreductase [Polyangiaceae bacterium]|jgi:NADH dehydrogenase|nr:NAD(P)/FAD-dependent oxidoreductase [Polyangiaceae bacterium]